MTETDWLLLIVAVLILIVFAERIAITSLVVLFVLITTLVWVVGGILGKRRL